MHLAVAEGGMDRALLHRKVAAVGVGVVEQQVSVVAHHILAAPAQDSLGGGVGEGGAPLGVEAVDALPRGAEDQLVLAFDALEHLLDPLPAHLPAPMLSPQVGPGAALLGLLAIDQGQ